MGINRSDYEEPICLLDMSDPAKPKVVPVDMGRISSKLDELLDRQEWAKAEDLLSYWLSEARTGYDRRGEFSILNEIAGLKRKLGKEAEATEAAEKAAAIGEELGIMDTVGGATAWLNLGTVYEAFGRAPEAVKAYEKVLPVYETFLDKSHPKLGGLYNNYAMSLSLTGAYDRAFEYYRKALDVMKQVPGGGIECALTFLNMANTYEAAKGLEDGAEEIEDCLSKAQRLLDKEYKNDSGYYAFMADKCIETYEYYGWFMYAKELRERVKDIYDGITAR